MTLEEKMRIQIDGDLYHVTSWLEIGIGDLCSIETEEGEEFLLSEDRDSAGEAAKERWADMVVNDPQEFSAIVGTETLVAWALGQRAGPGTVKVTSLSDWLDLVSRHPQDEWASYDGAEREVTRVGRLAGALGYVPTVAYRIR